MRRLWRQLLRSWWNIYGASPSYYPSPSSLAASRLNRSLLKQKKSSDARATISLLFAFSPENQISSLVRASHVKLNFQAFLVVKKVVDCKLNFSSMMVMMMMGEKGDGKGGKCSKFKVVRELSIGGFSPLETFDSILSSIFDFFPNENFPRESFESSRLMSKL